MRNEETVAAMACPVCKSGLSLSDRQGVEIDYCPTCRGVWLDRGELDKIIERNAADGAPPRQAPEARGYQEPARHYGDDDGYRRPYGKRKKSFLSELFD